MSDCKICEDAKKLSDLAIYDLVREFAPEILVTTNWRGALVFTDGGAWPNHLATDALLRALIFRLAQKLKSR